MNTFTPILTIPESAAVLPADLVIRIIAAYAERYREIPDDDTVEGLLYLASEAVEGEGMEL